MTKAVTMTDKRVDNQEGPDEVGRDDTPNVKSPSRPESVERAIFFPAADP